MDAVTSTLPLVLDLAADPLTACLAMAHVGLIRGWPHALLVSLNLWLFAELLAKLLAPDSVFGALMVERAIAVGLQVGVALLLVFALRQLKLRLDVVTAD